MPDKLSCVSKRFSPTLSMATLKTLKNGFKCAGDRGDLEDVI